jgi:hypothetical protein
VAEADESLLKQGLVPVLTAKQSRAKANDLKGRVQIEEERLKIAQESTTAQLAAADAELEKVRALLTLKTRQLAALAVRAGIDGVLQQIGDAQTLQVGQRISPSATLARSFSPANSRLRSESRKPRPGCSHRPDRLHRHAERDYSRPRRAEVDPAVVNGTVTVDVKLDGALPRGARPDLSVDGTIELERLEDALYVGRPVQGQVDSTVSLFQTGRWRSERGAGAGETWTHFCEHDRDPSGLATGRPGHPLRHVGMGWA